MRDRDGQTLDVQSDINIILDTLLKAESMIEWYRLQTTHTRSIAFTHAIDALGRLAAAIPKREGGSDDR